MATILMKMAGVKKIKAKQILKNGLAYKKMKEIIKAQGGNPNIKEIKLGKFTYKARASKKGKIKHISNFSIRR